MKFFSHISHPEHGGPYVNDLLLGMDAAELSSMVYLAAFRVIEACDSRSPHYVKPSNLVPTHHAEARARFMNMALGITPEHRAITATDAADWWSDGDLNLLKSFARVINGLPHDNPGLLMGKDWWILRAVYVALVTAQRHQVAVIKATHAVHGKHFGSALMYQRVGYAADVMDWPDRENWHVDRLLVPPLPKDEPGYLDEESSEGESSSAKPHGGFSTSDTARGPND